MKKTILVFGLISGLIVSTFMSISMAFHNSNPDFSSSYGMLVGYASMLIAFIFIFVGIKNYRDKYNQGLISFGKGFTIGILICLIASTMYVITWAIEYHFFMPDFMEVYIRHMVEDLQKSGATAAEIAGKSAEMEQYKELYKSPVGFALMTYAEIFPVGLIVTLICALILKRKTVPMV